MTRGIGTLAGLALVAGLLTGCGDDRDDDHEAASRRDPAPTTTAAAAPDPVVALKVHAEGTGPKRLLSAPLQEGAEERVTRRIEHDIAGPLTRTRTPATLTVTEVYDDGSARIELHSGPNVVDGIRGEDTWHRWLRATPEGRVLDGGALEGDAKSDPIDLDWDLQGQLTPVPDVPVGVGAEWSVRYATEVGGMAFQRTERYRVQAIRGDEVTLAQIGIEQSGTTEESKRQGDQDGFVFSVASTSYGTGTVTLVLGRLLAAETLDSELSTTTESTLDGRFDPEDGTPEREVDQSEDNYRLEVVVR